MPSPNKSLGQHWLKDREVLASIADAAGLTKADTVLEIGPGLGTLTSELLRRADSVVAVEFDTELARKLPGQFPGTNLTVVTGDILTFDLTTLPPGYKVAANIPYYITSKIVQLLMTTQNRPLIAVLLTQKEVAERLAAGPGDMSLLAVSAQVYSDVSLGPIVPAELFTPPPKVDSRAVILRTKQTPLVNKTQETAFFRVVKAGFSNKRKKLVSSLAGGMAVERAQAQSWLERADVDPDVRAEQLAVEDWLHITEVVYDPA